MAKRFTDTDKYKKPFIRGLQGAYKLLWDYLYHDCNHAGIWIVDFDIAQIYLGQDMQVNKIDALKYFNNGEIRVIEIESSKWFIPSFIDFQYGELSAKNRAHNSVINILSKHNLINNKGLIRGLQDPKDKDKDKYMDIDKETYPTFDDFWNLYDKKIGSKNKLEQKWNKLKQETKEKIMLYLPNYIKSTPDKKFRKNAETFLNNRSWNDEIILKPETKTYIRPTDKKIAL